MNQEIRVGTAGWSIPKQYVDKFDSNGTHLERYARRLPAVEINSSFYRPHRPATYARWAASVPAEFRFSVKVPRSITHDHRLKDAAEALQRFLNEVEALGERLGPLFVQLPPSLRYDGAVVDRFFSELRDTFGGQFACEPRHATWFTDEVDTDLSRYQVARVAADPAMIPRAGEPGGWPDLVYLRLHGSPKVYYSTYEPEQIEAAAQKLKAGALEGQQRWCIFDNTALGEATQNALNLFDRW